MSPENVRKLQVGERVRWADDPLDQGTIAKVTDTHVVITWDNGPPGRIELTLKQCRLIAKLFP